MPRYRLTALLKSDVAQIETNEALELVCPNAEAALLDFGSRLGLTLSWASDAPPDFVMEILRPEAENSAALHKIPVYVVRSRVDEL
jgi:hypothetical protein